MDRPGGAPHHDDAPGAGLDEVLTWNVVRVARFVGHRMSARLEGHGLNPIQFGVLAFLASVPSMTTAEVARAVLIRPQSMAPLLDGLAERGLVRRTGARSRGRPNPVQITDAGRRVLGASWDTAVASNDLADAGLSTGESAELNRLLLKIVRATEHLPQPEPDLDPPRSTSRARQ